MFLVPYTEIKTPYYSKIKKREIERTQLTAVHTGKENSKLLIQVV